MKKNTIFLISLLVLTACASTAPQGARVRPVDGQPHQPAFSSDGSATAYALQDVPTPQTPQSNEVGFLGTQTPQGPNSGNPVFPANSANDHWPNTNNTLQNNSANSTPQGSPIPATTAPVEQTPTTPAPATGGNAVKVLLDDARKAVQENRLDKAASSLERAVRLEPRNASIWYDLAQIRLHQKNYAAAEQMANKSISFTKNEDLIKRNRQIITAAQTARSAGN